MVIKNKYVCINCGCRVNYLYKIYTSSVIKVLSCDKCHEIADKYIEFEPIITLLDLVLLSSAAYRHVIFNTSFKLFWKLSLILLLLESFTLWRQNISDPKTVDCNTDENNFERYFYVCCLENLAKNLLIFSILQCIHFVLSIFEPKTQHFLFGKSFINLSKAVATANLSKFFLLPIMIWKDNTTEFGSMLHYVLVMAYFFLTRICVHSVVANCSRKKSAGIILITIAVEYLTVHRLNTWIYENFLYT